MSEFRSSGGEADPLVNLPDAKTPNQPILAEKN